MRRVRVRGRMCGSWSCRGPVCRVPWSLVVLYTLRSRSRLKNGPFCAVLLNSRGLCAWVVCVVVCGSVVVYVVYGAVRLF